MRLLLLYKQIFSSETAVFDPKSGASYKESEKEQRPSSLGVQGDILVRGLGKIGEEVASCDLRNSEEKERLYKSFDPDFVVGVGYWGDTPEFVDHPQKFGKKAVPWIVVDGAVLNYQKSLNQLKLVLTTSRFASKLLIRDGIEPSLIKVVYEGVDTEVFKPLPREGAAIKEIRSSFKVADNELMFYTLGGDAASKGVPETLEALSIFNKENQNWKYVVKVSLNQASRGQLAENREAVKKLGFADKVFLFSKLLSEEENAALMSACDVYVAPSHNESFGRPIVEAQAAGRPVLTVAATATQEVVRHGVTGFAAKVEEELFQKRFTLGEREGFAEKKEIEFEKPKLVGVKADPSDLAIYLLKLTDSSLRREMGEAGRKFVLKNFDYRKTAKDLVDAIEETFGTS